MLGNLVRMLLNVDERYREVGIVQRILDDVHCTTAAWQVEWSNGHNDVSRSCGNSAWSGQSANLLWWAISMR